MWESSEYKLNILGLELLVRRNNTYEYVALASETIMD